MKEFIEYIARQLVDQPDGVVVDKEVNGEEYILKLKVSQPDVGKIIGKNSGKKVFLRVVD